MTIPPPVSGKEPLNYQSPEKEPGNPRMSLILGILGMVAWCLPIVGLPVTVVGLIFGVKALKRPQNGMALAGTILNTIGLVLTVVNGAIGAYLGATGKLFHH